MKMMSTCRWCTSVAPDTTDLLQKYCSGSMSAEDEQAVNEDLCFCLECVVEYHRARDELPSLHKRLWALETSRLLLRFTQASAEELEEDDLLIVEDDQEIQVPKFTAAEYENYLRVPLTEMLKYPYLMAHPKLSELCVEALCKMEVPNSFQVFDKYQGIYLLLVHPSEMVRRWAIHAAKSLGKVDRDDFYDLQDIFTSMFCVIELDLFQNSDIDTTYDPKNGKMVLLPRHLYDSMNYKNYWLGLCMLLTVLDAQAMDSLLLSPDKQTDIMQCILNTMEKAVDDEHMDPFWPSLQCFMVILDRLGPKIWGHQIEPTPAFHTITGSPSYTKEIENIRRKNIMSKVKIEMAYDDDMVTCSQIIYDSNVKEKRKDTSIRNSKSGDSSNVIFEEMQSLVNVLQSDIGQDMRVHNSTFLWFIPFVQSVMDLEDLSIVYIGEVIHYLCGEVRDLIDGRIQTCDKVTEFFTLILVFIIELHLSKSRMNMLYYSSHKWVEVIVKCASLPCAVFLKGLDSGSHRVSSTSSLKPLSRNPQVSTVVPQACMQVIRSLLKEGGKLALHSKSMQFLDLLNKQIRVPLKELSLADLEVKELQNCLRQLVKLMKDKKHSPATNNVENLDALTPPPARNTAEPSFTENCARPLKFEQGWDSVQCSSKAVESRDDGDLKIRENVFLPVKKEPCVLEEHFETVSEMTQPHQPRILLDPGKLQLLKSKIGPSLLCNLQDIAKKQSDSKVDTLSDGTVLERFSKEEPQNDLSGCREEPEELRPSASNSERDRTAAQNHQCEPECSEYGDDVPLSAVKGFLKKSQKVKHLETQTEMKVDRGLNQRSVATSTKGHNGTFDASLEVYHVTERTEQNKKNKGRTAQGDHNQRLKVVESSLDVIVISDSESAKEDDDIHVGSNKEIENRFREGKCNIKSEPLNDIDSEKSYYHCDLGEIDSQLFEFETQYDVFSAWSDHSMSSRAPARETKKELPLVDEQLVSPGPSDPFSSLGYETEPISDEIIENALLEVEEQLKKQKHSVDSQMSRAETKVEPQMSTAEKTDVCVKPKVLPSKGPTRGSPYRKRKERQSVKNAVSNNDEQSKKTYREATSSKFAPELHTSSSSTPAIVPPKKVRKPVEPSSTVEKLGLKKKERKAFDLSQRSLDCVGQLRKYGQGFQLEQKMRTRRTRKSKVISPQKLIGKGHKRLLASQDLQFFRQSRAKPKSLHGTAEFEQANEKQASDQARKTNCKWNDILKPSVTTGEEQEKGDVAFSPLSRDSIVNFSKGERRDDRKSQEKLSTTETLSSTTAHNDAPHSGGHGLRTNGLFDDATTDTGDEVDDNIPGEDPEEGVDRMNLTQMEPVDMEMCSQMEEEDDDDDFFLTQRDPVDMDIDPESQMGTEKSQWIDQLGLDKAVTPQTASAVQKPSTSCQADEHVFLKPGLSPLSLKKAKPSTTKIYAPSSRSATLVQEMERTTKPQQPAAKKFVRPVLPARKINPPQPEFHPHPVNLPVPAPISTIVSSTHVPSYKMYARPETPVNKEMPRMDIGLKFDQSVLINTILSWTYDMFCSYTQFSIPSNVCNLPLKEVANSYKSFDEYFATFYPLLLINTFEELVKDWTKNGQVISHHLKVVGRENGNQIPNASFTASLSDRAVQHQLYPKEDDLVILWLPQNRSLHIRNEPELLEPRAYFGCVSRSTVFSAGDCPTLNLSIQTWGDVSSVKDQAVKCQLVGSLVSAIREFRALYLLKNNSIFRPILAPQVSYFQPGPDNVSAMSLSEYNPKQVKAIKWGVSIVRRQQRTPKICLIHGPPGTGKSKTIAGLLQSLFSERNATPMMHRHSKACRLRVLLCAPSNAAVDNLMKKVIVTFKENCRDIKNPLGNCGDINLVRLGMEKTISENLKPFSLDSQTQIRTKKAQHGHDVDTPRRKVQLDQHIENVSRECAVVPKNTDQFRKLMDQKSRLVKEREQLGRQLRETRSRRQETQAKVLQDAHVICCTLSTSGSVVLESAFRRLGHEPFSCVIVDEAGQATELETLIPMLYRCPALVLVGDPKQLPPTVVSQAAKERKYDQSLMARLWKSLHHTARENPHIPVPIIFLNRQYRMHPDICLFPSTHIYNKALETDRNTEENRCAITWPFQPYRVFDVTDGQETKERESFYNHKEVKLVLLLIKMILDKQMVKVGVITPYNAQKYRIQDSINREMAKEDGKHLQVEVDTVDGFQGREMDCVIVSCVRASSEPGSIGFLANRQRMNVTITRAKYSLFILGNLRTLMEHRDWGALIQDAGKRGTIIKTREKDFKTDAKQIFKPESAFMRSLSYPPKEPGLLSRVRLVAEAPAFLSSGMPPTGCGSAPAAGERAAPFGTHQGSDPPKLGVGMKETGVPQLPSRPPTTERPRDPRLVTRRAQPRPDPPRPDQPRPDQPRPDQSRPARWDQHAHSSGFSLSRSLSREECPVSQRSPRDWGRRESHPPQGPHAPPQLKRPPAQHLTPPTSAKWAKR